MIAVVLAGFARMVSGARPIWRGCTAEPRQRVYFANHTSHLDALVIWAVLPPALRRVTRPVAARDYWEAGPVRRYLATRAFNAVLIERTPGDFHHSPLDDLLAALERGDSLIFFPEGGRGKNGEVGEFRPGLYHLAERRPDVDLVPVYLSNLDRVMPRGSRLPVPLLSQAVFGAPLHLDAREGRAPFLARARAALLQLRDRP